MGQGARKTPMCRGLTWVRWQERPGPEINKDDADDRNNSWELLNAS